MAIRRFKSFEDARDALLVDPKATDLTDRIRRAWDFASRLAPISHPRGVWRFKSLEEASRHREAWIAERMDLLREQRSGGAGSGSGVRGA